MATLGSINVSKNNNQRRKPPITRAQAYEILLYVVLMVLALILGMYLGGWSLLREEENLHPDLRQSNTSASVYLSHLR